MHRLDVLFSQAEAGSRDLRGKSILVADAFRFSSTATLALAMGAVAVYPFDSVQALRAFAASRPGSNFLTIGDMAGIPVPGLDLDDSPSALSTDLCSGREVLAVTSNGARALKLVENRGLVLLLSFNNLSACAAFTAAVQGEAVVLCAGSGGRFAAEDSLAAGAFAVEAIRRNPELELTEGAAAARDLFVNAGKPLRELLAETSAAKALSARGLKADVDLCSGLDTAPLVPVFRGSPGRLALAESPPAGFAAELKPGGSAPETPLERGPAGPGPISDAKQAVGAGDGDGKTSGDGQTRTATKSAAGPGKDDPETAKRAVLDFRMPLGDHLTELRRRVIYSIVIALVAFVGVFSFKDPVIDLVLRPIQKAFDVVQKADVDAAPGADNQARLRPTLIAIKPYEVFMNHMKISFVVGLFLSSPLIFLQLWLFVSKGLYPWEKKWVYLFAPATYLSFLAGVVFLYFVVLPVGLQFLVGFGNHPDLMRTTGFESYVTFFMTMALVMGLVFELPLAMVFLARLGIVSPRAFASKRKHVIVAIFVVAAIITPPDVVTQVLVALPLCVLYEIGLILARLTYKERSASVKA